MPKRIPLPDWTDEDVYVIGGGHSLRGFDFNRLVGCNTIGCNQAFLLGAERCNICAFGDYRFWCNFAPSLHTYGGWVATNYWVMSPPDWLHFFHRIDNGLGTGDELAWNHNTGCLATNLALLLGARRVYLLGMDMACAPRPQESHWHDAAIEVPSPENYVRFADGFDSLKLALPAVYPGREVLNVTDGSSQLRCFPLCSFEQAGLGKGRE